MRILVTGGSGFLGQKLTYLLSKQFEVYGTYYAKKRFRAKSNYIYLNVLSEKQVNNLVLKLCPDVIIHTIGLPDPDICEMKKNLAFQLNIISTLNVAKAALQLDDCKIIYISTNYVFDGKNPPYKEDDRPNPLNLYGKTKLIGEEIIRRFLKDYIILRLPLLYGYNFQDKSDQMINIIRKLKKGEFIKVDDYRIRYPTLIDDVAYVIKHLIDINYSGICHMSSTEATTKYNFIMEIAKTFNLPTKSILRKKRGDLALRPVNPKLDVSLLLELLDGKVTIHNLREGLKIVKEQIIKHEKL